MVKLAALLIILSLLFGVEGARAIVFNTLGFAGWIVFWFLAACAAICAIDYLRKDFAKSREESKKAKQQGGSEYGATVGKALLFNLKVIGITILVVGTIVTIALIINYTQK